jgi:hypothetical protein
VFTIKFEVGKYEFKKYGGIVTGGPKRYQSKYITA